MIVRLVPLEHLARRGDGGGRWAWAEAEGRSRGFPERERKEGERSATAIGVVSLRPSVTSIRAIGVGAVGGTSSRIAQYVTVCSGT